jgi:hypothetical protein
MQTIRPSGMKQKFAQPENPLGENMDGNNLWSNEGLSVGDGQSGAVIVLHFPQ